MLKFENCSIGHDRTLYEIPELELRRGEFVALIGANGSGKSTLMDSLVQGKFPDGKVSIEGRNWIDLKLMERAHQITLVDNHFLGFDYLKVSEYLELGRHSYTNFTGRLTAEDRLVVQKYIQILHLDSLLGQSTSTLSDGERQRVGIAKALIQETPIILLDEPTAFLDYPTKREVMSLLGQIAAESNRMVMIASHDIDFCIEYCSRILIIEKDSKILRSYQAITHDELVTKAFGI
ncbi:ABC transporter ATP-binding protein [Fluviicola chungangensis]|uniref:ABC transporter ATP-binding protein n=1 Tax=Fluviicola chungangensis TaxID=2597671 RepID=A0A556MJU8_9FLAO|nr:ABC transporter ATP-binding protein [Fluviicola chungangensis]TSJ40170.1 ABC transporter ATP-binding protein [Fluviicola chungangensis]